MKNNKILEYYEGNPDGIIDNSDNKVVTNYCDDDAISFGYFPIDIYGSYEFLIGGDMHIILASEACNKLIGKAKYHISDDYYAFLRDQCYDKSYGLGRYWEKSGLIAFWALPTKKYLKDVIIKLNLSLDDYIVIKENEAEENITIREYLGGDYDGEDDEIEARNTPFRIDPKIKDIIEKYNEPDKSWQIQKEKNGWDTIAQRNAMIYQEGKERINEYFCGDPDTIKEFDDESCEQIDVAHFEDPGVLSFGFFQSEMNAPKEFMYSVDKSHHEMSQECAKKYIGMASNEIDKETKRDIAAYIYSNAAYKGRIFLAYHVITSWHRFSSKSLANILNKLEGGIEKYQNWIYLTDWSEEYRVSDYINKNDPGDEQFEAGKMKTPVEMYLSQELVEKIKQCNTPDSSWAAAKEKSGWNTLAQRNAMIYQEGKEPKKDIKENNKHMKKNNYTKEFSNYLQIMSEALDKKDFAVYDAAKEMLEETVDDCKREDALLKEMNTTNFGVLNHIFEEALPTLIKTNKKAVRNVIKTIKEDKNLMAEFNFYNLIDKYNSKISEMVTPEMMFQKLNETILEKIDPKEVRESNKKLKKVMVESGIVPLSHVGEEKMKLYESGHYMLSTAPSMTNVFGMYESRNDVINYMEAHKNDAVVEAVKPEKLIKDFENTLKEKLTESEISFVQQITDFRSPIAEQRKEKLFNKFKNECIDKINEMLKEDKDNVELKGLSDQINEMTFNKETIVKDIAKLLEIRDILLDE